MSVEEVYIFSRFDEHYNFGQASSGQFNKLASNWCQSSFGSSSGSADYFDSVMTKFKTNNRTDAWNTEVNLFFTVTKSQKGQNEVKTQYNKLNPTRPKSKTCLAFLLVNGKKGDLLLIDVSQSVRVTSDVIHVSAHLLTMKIIIIFAVAALFRPC